ncbi:MAG: GNAT family N-acetyltransferase [Lachnospiraceae bacterium]|nr:GNAT family N-acetyltransferase [Lachnospiraceae bacterium]
MKDVTIRVMEESDYEKVHELWMQIKKFGIRSIDDSREGVERFLRRNPGNSVVAEKDGEIVGTILCGHDGRRAGFYHVCVKEEYRKQGIGKAMVSFAMEILRKEKVNKISLVAFKDNELGNNFWNKEGWERREDLNMYDFALNKENITRFNS